MEKVKLSGVIDTPTIISVIHDAQRVLDEVGVEIESEQVKELLSGHNCRIEKQNGRKYDVALISPNIVNRCLNLVPEGIKMFDRNGRETADLCGDNVYFNPGSCATTYYDLRNDEHRDPTAEDLERFVKVADALPNIHMQSTAMNVSNVGPGIQDIFRLHTVLSGSTKPVVTGTFRDGNFERMRDMLVAIRGSKEELKAKPYAIFDCCPAPALKWPKTWSEDLIRCGKDGIPAQFISMPQPAVASPITLYDSLVQHTAETFSGIVIAQLANPRTPLIYGGSPNMPMGQTSLLGNPGTARFDAAYAGIAKYLGFPCQAYLGLSDSKTMDFQAGREKALTLLYAVLAGINNISGPGMLESENCQSEEMLVADNELCGDVLYLSTGLQQRQTDTIGNLTRAARGNFINGDEIGYLRDPSEFCRDTLADTTTLGSYLTHGKIGMVEKTIAETDRILREHHPEPLSREVKKELDRCLYATAR